MSERRSGYGSTRVLALVLALSALTGCARLALTLSEDPLADFRQAREEDDYDRALYIAEHLDPENKAHEPIREALPELRAEIERFEEDTIEAAEQLADRGHWDQVWQRLGQAMDQWRASPALRKAERQLRAREERESRVARTELLLAEARWRLSTMDLADRLSRFTLTRTHHQFQRWRQDNRALARELVTQGRWFAERDDWQRAHACLNNARALHAEAVPESLLAKAQDKVSAASRRSRANQARAARAQAREKHEQARAMLASYLNTGKLSQLLELRRFLGEHDNVGFPAELTARVEIVSRERFRTGMTEGDAHYARGEYRDARAIWRRIEPLAPPGSELSKKLERVQRVIDKLENLENR